MAFAQLIIMSIEIFHCYNMPSVFYYKLEFVHSIKYFIDVIHLICPEHSCVLINCEMVSRVPDQSIPDLTIETRVGIGGSVSRDHSVDGRVLWYGDHPQTGLELWLVVIDISNMDDHLGIPNVATGGHCTNI